MYCQYVDRHKLIKFCPKSANLLANKDFFVFLTKIGLVRSGYYCLNSIGVTLIMQNKTSISNSNCNQSGLFIGILKLN